MLVLCNIRDLLSAGSVGITAAYALGPNRLNRRHVLQLDTCSGQGYSPYQYVCLTLGKIVSPCNAQHGTLVGGRGLTPYIHLSIELTPFLIYEIQPTAYSYPE